MGASCSRNVAGRTSGVYSLGQRSNSARLLTTALQAGFMTPCSRNRPPAMLRKGLAETAFLIHSGRSSTPRRHRFKRDVLIAATPCWPVQSQLADLPHTSGKKHS